MLSGRTALKIYCLFLGFITTFVAFMWIALQIYALDSTSSDLNDEIVARYLDISFGALGLSSSLALLYGAFVESKTWLTVWTLGSTTLIIGRWAWFFYTKYGIEHPESLDEAQEMGVILSVIYIVLIIPVLIYYKYLESNHMSFSEWIHEILAGQTCNSLFGPFCAMFSIDYYRNIRQNFCSNNENGMTNGSSTTVSREAITSREGNNSEFYWDARLGNSREAGTDKYNKKRDAASPKGYRVVLRTGEKHSRIT